MVLLFPDIRALCKLGFEETVFLNISRLNQIAEPGGNTHA